MSGKFRLLIVCGIWRDGSVGIQQSNWSQDFWGTHEVLAGQFSCNARFLRFSANVLSDSEYVVATTVGLKTPTGSEVHYHQHRLEGAVHDARLLSWRNHGLGTIKTEHGSKLDLSRQVRIRKNENPRLTHATGINASPALWRWKRLLRKMLLFTTNGLCSGQTWIGQSSLSAWSAGTKEDFRYAVQSSIDVKSTVNDHNVRMNEHYGVIRMSPDRTRLWPQGSCSLWVHKPIRWIDNEALYDYY